MTSTAGLVYVLTIPRMPGIVKIGFTLKSIEERLKSLDNTSVVEPFQLYYAGKVNNPKRVEGLIHELYKPYRIRPNREFFEAEPADVKKIIQIAEASSDLYIAPDMSDTPEIEYTVSEIIDPEEAPSDSEKSPKRSKREKKEERKDDKKEDDEKTDKLEKFKYKRKESKVF